ncbi:MAG: thymidylate kinase [Flavobacteriaceae bacterium]|jgi:thymidylate kinase
MNSKKEKYIISWGELHATIFENLIKDFNNEGFKYFILRNYEALPQKNSSKDVDIIIEPGSYELASKLLKNILIKNKISNFKVVKYERVSCCFGIDIANNFSIHIDLIEGYLSKGFEVFDFEELYNQTEVYKNFNVLNSSYDAIMLLYYKVIGTKQLKEQYKRKISTIYKKEGQVIDVTIKRTLNKRSSDLIISALEKNAFDDIVENADKMSRSSKNRVFVKKPLKTTLNVIKFLFEKFYRIIICPRKFQNFISVQGADGTGKSTFIEGLVKAIAFYNVSEVSKSHVYHHRPTILPNLGSVGEKAKFMKEDKDFTNPHRAKPSGFIVSCIRMTYYWLDYVIGVPVKLRKDVQFDRFTIYDRYIYDFLIDPHRSRINLPYWLRKLFTNMVIQPRIVFVLLADAETIYKRKQELTIDEINRQLGEFSKLAKTHKRFVVINASKSPEDMVTEAMKVIINNFTEKL